MAEDATAAAGDLLAAALDYIEQGLAVFPLYEPTGDGCACGDPGCDNIGKHPRTPHGLKDATTDPDQARQWWARWPNANIAIATGAVSGIVVLDEDTGKGGRNTLTKVCAEHGQLPPTPRVLTGGGGTHYFFRHPGFEVKNSQGAIGPGLDVRGDGGYVVAAPSRHRCGRPYKWVARLNGEMPTPPPWLAGSSARQPAVAKPVRGVIPSGQRNGTLASLAGTMRRRGLSPEAVLAALAVENRERCQPPLPDEEVERIAASIGSRPAAADVHVDPGYQGPSLALAEVISVFQKHLHLPDPGPVEVTLAAVAANKITGDPVWLLLVGPAGGGKTETLHAIGGLDGVHQASTLTEAALLSGTPSREKSQGATGGLLRVVGDDGIVVLKDFGSILSLHRETRAQVLAGLREVYDGSWTRHLGTDGGKQLRWEGRLGLVAGCTPAIDQHHAVLATLGERFVMYRMSIDDSRAQARRSLRNSGNVAAVRRALRDAVGGLFAGLELDDVSVHFSDDDVDRLVALAVLVVRCRSAVIRDNYSREVELVPDAEAPGRLVAVLGRLLTGLRLIGCGHDEAWRLTVKTALDSMPAQRHSVLELLLASDDVQTTTDIATTLDLPTATSRRLLEDLNAHGVLFRISGGKGKADSWGATEWARAHHALATTHRGVPEMSLSPLSLQVKNMEEDITGKVGA